MNKPRFVYVTYIATTPEKVWQALVDSDVTCLYWGGPTADCGGLQHVSEEVKPGSRWESRHKDAARTLATVGNVLEATPPRRLVMTWARPDDVDATEKHSRVTFDIEPQGDRLVRLTIVHEDLDPDMAESVRGGWPRVLSNLKTLLETGAVLPTSLWK
jgi:uncharacterized protein YndB with AHSA1/START domain